MFLTNKLWKLIATMSEEDVVDDEKTGVNWPRGKLTLCHKWKRTVNIFSIRTSKDNTTHTGNNNKKKTNHILENWFLWDCCECETNLAFSYFFFLFSLFHLLFQHLSDLNRRDNECKWNCVVSIKTVVIGFSIASSYFCFLQGF